VLHFTFESANIVKIERLRSLGYVVEVLWDRQGQTGIQGTIIREKVQNEDESWKNQLHPAVVEILLRTNLISKMKLRE
jgi:hypothetical protein